MNVVELEVQGMTCGSCAARVRNALMRVTGVDSVSVDVANRHATVQSFEEDLMTDELVSALADIGYPAKLKPLSASEPTPSGSCGAGKAQGRSSGCCCGA
jgi:copper chaperone CopZ